MNVEEMEEFKMGEILKISLRDRVTNEHVLCRVDEDQRIIKSIGRRKANCMLRYDFIQKAGQRDRGRRRMGVLDCLKSGEACKILKEKAQDVQTWQRQFLTVS